MGERDLAGLADGDLVALAMGGRPGALMLRSYTRAQGGAVIA